MDATITLKRAFGIDEVLLTIYGYLVGNDMNSNVKMMKVRLVSSRFNKFFLSCLRSTPLQLEYVFLDDDDPREDTIFRWLKSYDIATLSKLVVNIVGRHIPTFCFDFDGLDLSNLRVLNVSISETNGVQSYFEDIFFSFAQASSLTSLKLYHSNYHSNFIVSAKTVYDKCLSYFPVLNSLEVTLDDYENILTTLEYPKKLEHLVLHGLRGNLAFRSESIKTLDLSSNHDLLNSIISIDCPSLEKIICRSSLLNYPRMMIAGITTDTLAEQFGNTDEDYIADYLQSNTHHLDERSSLDIKFITSISVVPIMDYITGRNIPIKVKSDCVIILFDYLNIHTLQLPV